MRNYIYTICLIASVSVAYFFPQYFTEINGFQLKELIIPLLQIIMFGMGTTMTYDDFLGVIKMPKAVIVGLVCQFPIMPFLGFAIASSFNFPPEIAAGIILVGCSPSGLASNVISYISKANVALSITITSLATMLAPLFTPFLMKLLGGQFIAIEFWPMVIDICKMIIVPIAIGFLINKILKDKNDWLQKYYPLFQWEV